MIIVTTTAVVAWGALGIALLPWREQERDDTITGLRILAAHIVKRVRR